MKSADAIKPKEFANRFEEGADFLKRHIGDEAETEAARYRKTAKTFSDAEVDTLVKNLDNVGEVNLARIINSLKADTTKGMGFFDDLRKRLKGVKKFSKEERKAMGAVYDTGIDEGMKNLDAKWKKVGETVLETDDPLKYPFFKRFWSRVKGSPKAKEAMTKHGIPLFKDLPLWVKFSVFMGVFMTVHSVWKTMQDFCFALFMGEETLQWVGFGGIPLMTLTEGWEQKPLARKKEIIAIFEDYYNKRAAIHAFVTGNPVPALDDEAGQAAEPDLGAGPLTGIFEELCILFGPYFKAFWEANRVNLWCLAQMIDDLNRGINLFTGIGECNIKVSADKDGAAFWYQGSHTKTYATSAKSWVYLYRVPVREEPYTCSIMAVAPGYVMSAQIIDIFPGDSGAGIEKDHLALEVPMFKLIPDDDAGTNPFLLKPAPDTTHLPPPYGDADPIEYIGGELYGSIKCESIPTGAGVYLDVKDADHYKGKTNIKLDYVPVGLHRIIQTFPNFNDCVVDVSVVVEPMVYARCRFPTPTCDFTPSTTTPKVDEVVTFDATDSVPGTGATSLTYDWDWADETTHGTKKIDTHAYDTKGVYAVKLTVTNEMGGSKTCTKNIVVEVPTGNLECICSDDFCKRGADIYYRNITKDETAWTEWSEKTSSYPTTIPLEVGNYEVKYELLNIVGTLNTGKPETYEVEIIEGQKTTFNPTMYLIINGVVVPEDKVVYEIPVRVSEVLDGDSFRVSDYTGKFNLDDKAKFPPPTGFTHQQIRISGYDAFEYPAEYYGEYGKNELKKYLTVGKTVTLQILRYYPLGKLNRVLASVKIAADGIDDVAMKMLPSCLVKIPEYSAYYNTPATGGADAWGTKSSPGPYRDAWLDPWSEECLLKSDEFGAFLSIEDITVPDAEGRGSFTISNRGTRKVSFYAKFLPNGETDLIEVAGGGTEVGVTYFDGSTAIILYACIEKCDIDEDNWIQTDFKAVPKKEEEEVIAEDNTDVTIGPD